MASIQFQPVSVLKQHSFLEKMQITSQGVSELLGSTKGSIEDIGVDVYVAKYSIFTST